MKWRVLGVLFLALSLFLAGYTFAEKIYKEQIAEIQKEAALESQKQSEKYREVERRFNVQLVNAINERDAALASVIDLRTNLERVRREYISYQRRVSEEARATEKSDRAPIRSCENLLLRAAELSARCGKLLQGNALNHDALAKSIE